MKNSDDLLEGQMSIWDLEIVEKSRNIIKRVTSIKIEEPSVLLELTEKQQKFLEENRIMKNGSLSRLIKYCGGGFGIEFTAKEGFKTIYVNKGGEKEFEFNKKSPVLPIDKILYCKTIDITLNSFQERRLNDLKVKYPKAKVIRRKGDENIILELEDKVISITPKWELEFNDVQATYIKSEVIKEEIRKKVKCGDIVEAIIGKEKKVVQGKITRAYGLGEDILNIVYESNHTAIGRYAIRKIIKCA